VREREIGREGERERNREKNFEPNIHLYSLCTHTHTHTHTHAERERKREIERGRDRNHKPSIGLCFSRRGKRGGAAVIRRVRVFTCVFWEPFVACTSQSLNTALRTP
jgi:hypothetical protein